MKIHPLADAGPDASVAQTVASERWPLLSVCIERTEADECIHFLVSGVAPDGFIGPVVLGVDMLTSVTEDRLTLVVRFDIGAFTVSTVNGCVVTRYPEAAIEFRGDVVTVRMRLGARLDARCTPVGFCIIDGALYQLDVPVTVLAAPVNASGAPPAPHAQCPPPRRRRRG
jgi:hypothetical protein